MAQDIPKDWYEMLLATYTAVCTLEKRMDKHSCEYSDNFKVVFTKLDKLTDRQHESELRVSDVELTTEKKVAAAKEYTLNKMDAKMVTWMAAIAAVIQSLGKAIGYVFSVKTGNQ